MYTAKGSQSFALNKNYATIRHLNVACGEINDFSSFFETFIW